MKKFFDEFKTFITKGNVVSMAVGIIIGGAFTAIVNSLVADIVTPLIGLIIGGVNFTALSFGIGGAQIMYGNFIQAIIVFLITAFVLFLVVKFINKLSELGKKKEEEAPAAPPQPSEEVLLLREIRDSLKK